MNTASLENCKKLYELSGWGDKSLEPIYGDLEQISTGGHYARPVIGFAYDLGYLLRKLPDFRLHTVPSGDWVASSLIKKLHTAQADNAEDAACLLAIKLFEEAVL